MCRHSHAYLFGIAAVAAWFAACLVIALVGVAVHPGLLDPCDIYHEHYRDGQIATLEPHVALLQRRVDWMRDIPEPDRPVRYEKLRAELAQQRRALLQLRHDRVACMMR